MAACRARRRRRPRPARRPTAATARGPANAIADARQQQRPARRRVNDAPQRRSGRRPSRPGTGTGSCRRRSRPPRWRPCARPCPSADACAAPIGAQARLEHAAGERQRRQPGHRAQRLPGAGCAPAHARAARAAGAVSASSRQAADHAPTASQSTGRASSRSSAGQEGPERQRRAQGRLVQAHHAAAHCGGASSRQQGLGGVPQRRGADAADDRAERSRRRMVAQAHSRQRPSSCSAAPPR